MTLIPPTLVDALADRYRIERELGAGGMATVYLAQDLKHERQVAIKVLRPELAAVIGAERFLAEIKTTANLRHPHILPLFDSGSAESFLFYVMPFIEGESLRDRLNREKQLPIADAVRIATEVATALDYAHRHGVIHRDVKPENVLLHDGSALVADFGIALAASKAGGSRVTETGMSLGTPTYMSPEQAMGEREITARSDVYALGAMTYEMLLGEPPFTGPTAQSIVAKVMTEKPASLIARRDRIPPPVEDAVLTALEKLPADRFETAADFARALGDSGFSHRSMSRSGPAERMAHRAGRPVLLVAFVIGGLLVGASAGWLTRGHSTAATAPVRFYLDSDSTRTIGQNFAISPDGSTVVYLAKTPSGRMLFIQRLSELEPRPIAGTSDATEGAGGIFFSPDGSSIGFDAGTAIKRIRLDGSELATVTSLSGGFAGATWGADGSIIYSTVVSGVLYRVSSQGGNSVPVPLHAGSGTPFIISPQILPGGKVLLCTDLTGAGQGRIGVLILASGEFRPLRAGLSPVYLPSGNLLFGTSGGSLMIQPFDATRGDTTGPASGLVENISTYYGALVAYAASASGSLVYLPRGSGGAELQLVQRDGTVRNLSRASRFWVPRISPDGRRIAYGAYGSASTSAADLWSYDLTLNTDQRLTSGGQAGRDYNDPVWSRDGSRMALSGTDSTKNGSKDLYLMPSDATSPPVLLLDRPGEQWPSDWTPDGKNLLFTDTPPNTHRSIWLVSTSGGGKPRPVVQTAYNAIGGRLSPDGRWLAYDSDETGQSEVYVQPFPGPGPRLRVSPAGGQMPVWARSGKELYYISRNQLLAVALTAGRELVVGARKTLFQAGFIAGGDLAQYDVHPDGKQFVVSAEPDAPHHLAVISNLLAGVKR